MEVSEARSKFIESWGKLGTNWGVNRTMAQIHALLLVSPAPLCTNEIIEELKISRGNVNQNVRMLMDWGLVHKELRCGDRKEYFYAEKDIWTVLRQVIKHRKKRELDPLMDVLGELTKVENNSPESRELLRISNEIFHFSKKTDKALDNLVKSEKNWLTSTIFNMIR
ncbi:MAG: ArsR family transcriptional regulator [Saprospirales bacterium]|nr:MAG: ArsR family transcriptional regulator [Saprospirales bacterium]